jgi:hypothetical protein
MMTNATMTKKDYVKKLKSKILAGKSVTLRDIIVYLCPGSWRVEIYTEKGHIHGPSHTYRGFFKFSEEELIYPCSENEEEPYVEANDRDCGIMLDLHKSVKIVDDHLLYKSSVGSYDAKKEMFKLYFIEDKPLNFANQLMK